MGKAITLMLAQNGANVVVNYHSSAEAALKTVSEAEAYGVRAMALQCDVSDVDSVRKLAQEIVDAFGHIDILINAADRFERHPFPTDDVSVWRRVLRVSVDGSFYVSNAVAPLMIQRGLGVIVNIVDLSAWQPRRNFMAHSVGKAALLAMTRQMAVELAPAVRVNAVAPGPVLAPPGYTDEQKERIANRTLLKRWGSAEDVAFAVKYLVEADYVTGDLLTVDGGEQFGP